MPVAGRRDNINDYPNTIQCSQSTLPFHFGNTVTLGCTGVAQDLVLVTDLRRFENMVIARGTHTGCACCASLVDSTEAWDEWGVVVGDLVTNVTDCCATGLITAIDNATNTITVTLAGGTDDDFDACDVYNITSQGGFHRANEIREFGIIVNQAIYLKIDGEASACDHDAHLLACESWTFTNKRAASRISYVNVTACQTPQARFTAWGL